MLTVLNFCTPAKPDQSFAGYFERLLAYCAYRAEHIQPTISNPGFDKLQRFFDEVPDFFSTDLDFSPIIFPHLEVILKKVTTMSDNDQQILAIYDLAIEVQSIFIDKQTKGLQASICEKIDQQKISVMRGYASKYRLLGYSIENGICISYIFMLCQQLVKYSTSNLHQSILISKTIQEKLRDINFSDPNAIIHLKTTHLKTMLGMYDSESEDSLFHESRVILSLKSSSRSTFLDENDNEEDPACLIVKMPAPHKNSY